MEAKLLVTNYVSREESTYQTQSIWFLNSSNLKTISSLDGITFQGSHSFLFLSLQLPIRREGIYLCIKAFFFYEKANLNSKLGTLVVDTWINIDASPGATMRELLAKI